MSITRHIPGFLINLILLAGVLAGTTVSGKELNRLEQFLGNTQTFSADFEQVQLSEFGEEMDVASGSFRLFKPGRFYWLYEAPYLQRIISNGEVVWVYDEDLEQVTINSAALSMDDVPTLIINGNVDLKQYYEVQEFNLEGGRTVYELLSRNEDSQYHKVLFTFLPDTLESMTLHDALGRTTRITFSNTVHNPDIDMALFDFTVPAEIDVIDNRQEAPPPPPLE